MAKLQGPTARPDKIELLFALKSSNKSPLEQNKMEAVKHDLSTKGYAIVENVLTPEQVLTAKGYFQSWLQANPELQAKHKKNDPHGIFKYAEVGHQRHAWYLKTLDSVQEPFRAIWGTNELTTGFDGACWIPSAYVGKDKIWTHTDQAPDTKGLACIQSFVALTSNVERTLVVYEGSHLLHEDYMREKNLTGKKNWLLIEPEYLARIAETKRVLAVKAGSLVLWDSRTFHQNQYGPSKADPSKADPSKADPSKAGPSKADPSKAGPSKADPSKADSAGEERIVQYVCFLPKAHRSNTKAQQKKRVKYFEERRTTSHWPYPLHVNGLQPQTYGNKSLLIDYTQLQPPDLSEFEEEIRRLL